MKEQKNLANDSCFSSNNKGELKLLSVLMNESDYRLIMSLKSRKSITKEALCECGDIIITNLRAYC